MQKTTKDQLCNILKLAFLFYSFPRLLKYRYGKIFSNLKLSTLEVIARLPLDHFFRRKYLTFTLVKSWLEQVKYLQNS